MWRGGHFCAILLGMRRLLDFSADACCRLVGRAADKVRFSCSVFLRFSENEA